MVASEAAEQASERKRIEVALGAVPLGRGGLATAGTKFVRGPGKSLAPR